MSVFLHYEQGMPMTLLTVYDPASTDASTRAPASRTDRGWLLPTLLRLARAIAAQTTVLHGRPGNSGH